MPLSNDEHRHMEYFQAVCAAEFSIFFEDPAWKTTILQCILVQPTLHHAALAIGALTRSRYHPRQWQQEQLTIFSIEHYRIATQGLILRLDGSVQSLELAILASILFGYIEFLLGIDSMIMMHVRAGFYILETLKTKKKGMLAVVTESGTGYLAASPLTLSQLLANSMFRLTSEFNHFAVFADK